MLFHWVFCLLSDWVISIILSSKSLILSSALFILLFSAFNSVSVSENKFYNFSWFLLIFSSSFLKKSALLLMSTLNYFIFTLNSFSIFTTSLWNSVSVRLQRSVSLFSASCEFCSFNWECFLSFFILPMFFFLFFFFWLFLGPLLRHIEVLRLGV